MASFECLEAEATQSGFAGLVGISQPAVFQRVKSGVLEAGGSYWDWLLAYTEELRKQASGRNDQEGFQAARVDDMKATAAMKRLSLHEKAGNLIVKPEAHALLANWASFAVREYSAGVSRMVADIESQCGITVPPEVIEKHAATAIRRVGDYGRSPEVSGGGSGGDLSTEGT